jgi:MoxR-like ATPase
MEHPERIQNVLRQLERVVLGKRDQLALALTCLFAGGHLLIEDLPGIGKTTMAQGLARCLGLEFRRVQFTSDLLPGDILGVSVYQREQERFVFHSGPIFTQVLLADEINRATPRTQSALLEAMEEGQVTIEGKTRPLLQPFFVLATQNPMEHSGTYPLPDSQLDRFLMRIELGYPGREAEERLLLQGDTKGLIPELSAELSPLEVREIQGCVEAVHAAPPILEYILDLLRATRESGEFLLGLSPRAGLGLLRAARSHAFLHQRDHVLPEDVQAVLPWTTRHRLRRGVDLREPTAGELMEFFRSVPLP